MTATSTPPSISALGSQSPSLSSPPLSSSSSTTTPASSPPHHTSTPHDKMAVTHHISAGAERARWLLNGIPDRFNDFCRMDQFTFVQLADWILENAESSTCEEDISVEESLFVFLDIVAHGNTFRNAAYEWDHDVKLTQSIFLNVLNALRILGQKCPQDPTCPPLSTMKSRWRIMKALRPGKTRMFGRMRVGDDHGCDGIDVEKQSIVEALSALNNFIHECKEF